MAIFASLVLVVSAACPQQDESPAPEKEREALRLDIERHEEELDSMRVRLEALEDDDRPLEASLRGAWDELRINVYGNIIGSRDDERVENEDGDEVGDRGRVRRVDFDFRAPLGRSAQGVVIGSLLADPVSDFDSDLEEGYVRVDFLQETNTPIRWKGGKIRSAFGRNNRLRIFENPQPNRPLVVQEFLGEDGFNPSGSAVAVGLPTGSESHDLVFNWETLNSGDIAISDDDGGQPIALMLNLDWFWRCSETSSVRSGASWYRGRENDESLGGFDLLFQFQPAYAGEAPCTIGFEAMLADPEGSSGDDPVGAYVWSTIPLWEDWFASMRLEYVERAEDADLEVKQGGVFLSWLFTERLRATGGYERSEGDESFVDGANHFQAELSFSMGPDPIVPFWARRTP